MEEKSGDPKLEKIRNHAFSLLSFRQRQTTNLHIDPEIYRRGEAIGPEFQKIRAERDSILVFADDDPFANFGHPCRYLLYEAESGDFEAERPARFPPVRDVREPRKLIPFHEPKKFIVDPNLFRVRWPIWRCPILRRKGRRYAILFSGMSNKRHLNDMEFLYRTLVDIYGFDTANIQVLNYDGTLNTQDGVQAQWPGDSSAYRIQVDGEGNQAGFESAIDSLKPRLKAADTLLIHCNNHGDYDNTPGSAYLCTYSNWGQYYNADFSAKIAELPHFRQLIVMLEQCNSGGFNASIIANSPADATSVASAATESQSSYVTADGNWDPFARDWIAAQAGSDPFGAALAFNPDSNGNGEVEASEAFDYADAVKDPRDSPNFSQSSAAGGAIGLGQDYHIWWWWCIILREILEERRFRIPPEEYGDRLKRLIPELEKLTEHIDKQSDALRTETAERLRALVDDHFR